MNDIQTFQIKKKRCKGEEKKHKNKKPNNKKTPNPKRRERTKFLSFSLFPIRSDALCLNSNTQHTISIPFFLSTFQFPIFINSNFIFLHCFRSQFLRSGKFLVLGLRLLYSGSLRRWWQFERWEFEFVDIFSFQIVRSWFSNGVGSGAAKHRRVVAEARASWSWQAPGMDFDLIWFIIEYCSDYQLVEDWQMRCWLAKCCVFDVIMLCICTCGSNVGCLVRIRV